ncbi:MAG TPA: PAS domain S-box protein [Deltaproteobacteria bacterium]|nr:PAS domain S-box protein [Deltaproteobacteria bacterium]HPR54897.1 PAS domain S-box protein [Deltaproteobacteria bacterium]HXK48220.1 PAS domain S-box protein [Deltaproteobacteria bacterium]
MKNRDDLERVERDLKKRRRKIGDPGAPRKAEERLQESEKKYRTIFENTGTATILIDENTTIAMANTEFAKLTGYSRRALEGKMSWVEFIHEDDRSRMVDYHYRRRLDAKAAPRNYECRFINRYGRTLVCYLTVAVLPGTPQSVASFMDLTDMMETREALKASEERYRQLVETMSDGLGVQDEHGIITYVNERICEMLGYGRDELIGRPAFDLLAEASRGVWIDEMVRRKSHRTEPYEVAWHNRRGEIIHTLVSPRAVRNAQGRFVGSFAVFTDITSRKKAEEALKRSEEMFARAFRSSPDAITITILENGLFLDVNDSFLRITGYTRDEAIGHTSIELGIWPSPEFRREVMAQLAGKGSIKDLEVDFRTKSGDLRRIVYAAEPIELQGRPCLISVFADVTEQRHLEREILEIGERERQKIGQDLHDDLQQHLIGTEALALSLENRLAAGSRDEAAQAHDITGLIREAIAKTRAIARGLSPLYIDEEALITAIRDLAGQVEAIFGVSFRLDVGRDVHVKDNATAVHIYRIIQEAVNNAVRHGRAGRITISLKTKRCRLALTITDNGSGIPDDVRKGTGMGLSIMRHRAKMIGARIDIRKNQKGGTSVICQLDQGS